jgi:dipeptidyl aminopeptidase/acylaminoacyl peptidase
MFDPLLAALSQAGIAVVAPNIRGSIGYGRAHSLAIRDDWGGPDLADVLAICDSVDRQRERGADRPVVLGTSYGAYLAILAAQSGPARWSRCIALAPFLSGARVAATGGPVAELVRRLGGTSSPDLRARLDHIAAPVLVVHGAHDDVVPIAESRLLAAALRERGKDITLHEFADAGHDLVGCAQRAQVIDTVLAFCHRRRGLTDGHDQPTARREGMR